MLVIVTYCLGNLTRCVCVSALRRQYLRQLEDELSIHTYMVQIYMYVCKYEDHFVTPLCAVE